MAFNKSCLEVLSDFAHCSFGKLHKKSSFYWKKYILILIPQTFFVFRADGMAAATHDKEWN